MIRKYLSPNVALLLGVALIASLFSPFHSGMSFSMASSTRIAAQAPSSSLIAQIQKHGELRVCYGPAQPHSYVVNGQWVGIAVDIMKDWAQVLGVKMVPVSSTFGAMIAAVQAGRCDVAASLNARPARALAVIFSSPYIDDIGVFVVNAHTNTVRTWQQLNKSSTTVCVVQGSAEDLSLSSAAHQTQLLRLADENACRLAFQSGRAQAFFDDISGNLSYAQANPDTRIIDPQPPLEKEGIAFGIDQGYGYGDVQALNIEIDHVINEGILGGLEQKYGLVTDLTPYEKR